jgi:hypothetical protein
MFDPKAELQGPFADLLFLALDHAVDSIRGSEGPLIPFVMSEAQGKRALQRYVAERLEDSVARARVAARQLAAEADRWALAWDGYLTHKETGRTDALFVEAGQRGKGFTVLMAQRYRRSASGFETIGNPTLCGEGDLLITLPESCRRP